MLILDGGGTAEAKGEKKETVFACPAYSAYPPYQTAEERTRIAMNIAVANRLVQLRNQRGWTQEELAEKLNVSRQAVSKWERAESSPDTENLIALSALYGVSLDTLLGTGFAAENGMPPVSPQEEPSPPDGQPAETGIVHGDAEDRVLAVLLDDEDYAVLESVQELGDDPPEFVRPGGRSAEWAMNQFPYPVFLALLYVCLGFAGGWWHPAWLLFLTIPIYYLIGQGIDKAREATGIWGRIHAFLLANGLFPVLIAALYLTMGVLWGVWHPGWCIFLLIPLFYCIPEPRKFTDS